MISVQLPSPYLLFIGAETDLSSIKTACGLKDWAPERCVGEWALAGATVTTGLPRLSLEQAASLGAASVVIGVAPAGGRLDPAWIAPLTAALQAGLDIISGMHARLEDEPAIASAAAQFGRALINVRHMKAPRSIGTGRKRSGKRLLTVGTDCALGKKYTALALTRALRARGLDVDFRATGQTGIMIAGSGVPIDATVADFLAGAAEALSPDAPPDHWDVIEGQGSLFHPSYAAVTLGLLHGSQPDILVLCHAPGRDRIHGLEDFATPKLGVAIAAYLQAARLTNPAVRCAGISLNTAALDKQAAMEALRQAADQTGLPAADPIRGFGLEALIESCVLA